MGIKKSDIVESTAGRDEKELFFVLEVEEGFVYLADGKKRKVESPKRKKIRHVRFEAQGEARVAEKLKNGEKVTNSELRRALAEYRSAAEEREGE